jgi:hypothetical protein
MWKLHCRKTEKKVQYPDIENCDNPLSQWEKDFIDKRLTAISQNPERLQPIETLFQNS